MLSETDKELLTRYAATNDDTAFAELVSRYGAMVYRVCRRILGSPAEAEDAAQASFVVLARKAGSLRQEGRVNGWLHRVARNVALQAVRRRAERERLQAQAMVWQEDLGVDAAETDRQAILQHLDAELDGLSTVLREALVLRFLRGLSEKEAAAQAGCPVGTMKWRASEGLAKLRARLNQRGLALNNLALLGLLQAGLQTAVPETLPAAILATVKTAAGAGAASAAGSAKALTLAKGALKTLFWAKVRTAATAVVLTAGVAVGGGLVAQQLRAARPHALPPPVAAVRPPATPAAPVTGGMVLIPGGTNAGTDPDTQKPYSLTVVPFLMDRCEVTKALWDEVAAWGRDHGYSFSAGAGQGKAPDHPVHSVSWVDCVIWCNARSEKDGFAPVYHVDAAGSVVLRELANVPYVTATADGYRLPTVVEWQYAARGGQPSHRFPWHDAETIDHSRANYQSYPWVAFDTSPTRGFHPAYSVDPRPYTSPVGVFAPNAYGLYDMIGNVNEWCFREGETDDHNRLFQPYAGGSCLDLRTLANTGGGRLCVKLYLDCGVRTVRTPGATAKVSPSP